MGTYIYIYIYIYVCVCVCNCTFMTACALCSPETEYGHKSILVLVSIDEVSPLVSVLFVEVVSLDSVYSDL